MKQEFITKEFFDNELLTTFWKKCFFFQIFIIVRLILCGCWGKVDNLSILVVCNRNVAKFICFIEQYESAQYTPLKI